MAYGFAEAALRPHRFSDLSLRPSGWGKPPDLSLRGSAGAAAISQYTPGTQESPGEIVSAYLRLPRRACAILAMTREEGTLRFALAPLRVKQAIRFVIARLRRSRGNLAGCSRNTGKPPANSQVRSRERHAAPLHITHMQKTKGRPLACPCALFCYSFA